MVLGRGRVLFLDAPRRLSRVSGNVRDNPEFGRSEQCWGGGDVCCASHAQHSIDLYSGGDQRSGGCRIGLAVMALARELSLAASCHYCVSAA